MNDKIAKMVNIEISARIADNSGLTLGEEKWQLKGFARKNLLYLNPESFNEYLHYCIKEAVSQATAHYLREARVAEEQRNNGIGRPAPEGDL